MSTACLIDLSGPSLQIGSPQQLCSELTRLASLEPRLVLLTRADLTCLALALLRPGVLAFWPHGPYILRNRVVRHESPERFVVEDAIALATFVYVHGCLPTWVGADGPACANEQSDQPNVPRNRGLEQICVLPGSSWLRS
jgi:hypothetical protein